jgi:hydroxyacylglutathione hydrolase
MMEFEVIPVTRLKQNCSIVWCEQTRAAAVIDPGGDLAEIVSMLEVLDLVPEVALITHAHFDHFGGVAQFAEMTGARIEGPHRADEPAIASSVRMSERYGVKARPYTPARWLEHGDRVHFGEETLEVLHCPGHCPGHVAYFSQSRRWAFVGDILFKGTIGAWEHPQGDLATLIGSITEKLFPLGDDVGFVPGHGETSTLGAERRDNPFVGDEAMRRWHDRFPLRQV